MKINAIIVEDERHARLMLCSYLKKYYPNVTVRFELDSVQEAVHVLNRQTAHILFLDVQLRDGLGTEILRRLRSKHSYRIIFTTAHDNYTQEAFHHKAFGYLLKPLDPSDFKGIMNRVIKDITFADQTIKRIKVPTSKGYVMIDTSNIVRCESESNYTRIICDTQSYILSKTLKWVEQEVLQDYSFVRVHQSHLVNIDFVNTEELETNYLNLTNGDRIPVSRSKRSQLRDKLEELNH